jgi:hypothetical protein
MKWIDAECLKAEIERLYDGEAPKHDQQCDFDDEYFTGIGAISKFIDYLQQEQPEVDLEEDETVTDCNEYSTVEEELDTFIKSGKAIKEENCGTYTITYIDPLKVARHFYEHGLNARKEE